MVYSRHLVWQSAQDQAQRLREADVRPVHDDIVIAQLQPGQRIKAKCFAYKGEIWVVYENIRISFLNLSFSSSLLALGNGSMHAKFSPVGTAFYRMLPKVELLRPVEGNAAERLAQICPKEIFDVEDLGKVRKAKVRGEGRDCTLCQECIRVSDTEEGAAWKGAIKISRVENHFVFVVESVGQYHAKEIFREALMELRNLMDSMQTGLKKSQEARFGGGAIDDSEGDVRQMDEEEN